MAINEITENDVVNFFSILKNDRGISQAIQNRYRSCLNHIFNCALKEKLITFNPVRYTQKFKEKNRERALNEDEIKTLLQACRESSNNELYYIVLVALYTGMRYSNIVNMKKSKMNDNIYLLEEDETKSGKSQVIYLHPDLLKELNHHMQKSNNGNDIFKYKFIKRAFRTALKKANINNFRFHDLRRTFATTLLNNNANIKVIQCLLGHSSITMTERYLASDSKKEIDTINKLCFI